MQNVILINCLMTPWLSTMELHWETGRSSWSCSLPSLYSSRTLIWLTAPSKASKRLLTLCLREVSLSDRAELGEQRWPLLREECPSPASQEGVGVMLLWLLLPALPWTLTSGFHNSMWNTVCVIHKQLLLPWFFISVQLWRLCMFYPRSTQNRPLCFPFCYYKSHFLRDEHPFRRAKENFRKH